MSACTSTTTYTVTPLKSAPKGIDKVHKAASKKSTVTYGPQRTNALVQIIDIGPTIDGEGNLVGPHKYYKIVKTETWTLGKSKEAPTFVKEGSPTDQMNKAVAKAEDAAKRAEEARNAIQTQVAQSPPNSPLPQEPSNIDAYMHPVLPNDDQALRHFNEEAANPAAQ